MEYSTIPAGDFFHVRQDRDQELEDIRGVLRTQAGRRMIRRVLAATNVMGLSVGTDSRSTEYNEGLRAIGIWLAASIELAAPGDIARLMLESSSDRQMTHSTRRSRNG